MNPQQIAILRWYAANLTIQIPVGNQPNWIVFDGENIWGGKQRKQQRDKAPSKRLRDPRDLCGWEWATRAGVRRGKCLVANHNSNNVTKLRASDGTIVGTYPVGNDPASVVFDGINVWVVNHLSNTVSKLRPRDGNVLGTFAVGGEPEGIAFDGTNIWVANTTTKNVTKLRASDGTVLGTFAVGNFPCALAFDGAHIWVANASDNTVTKLQLNGTSLGTFAVVVSRLVWPSMGRTSGFVPPQLEMEKAFVR